MNRCESSEKEIEFQSISKKKEGSGCKGDDLKTDCCKADSKKCLAPVNTCEAETSENVTVDTSEGTDTSTSPAIGVALEMDSELKSLMEEYDESDVEQVENEFIPSKKLFSSSRRCQRVCDCYKIGSSTVLFPKLYKKTSLGIIGPHYFGVIFTVMLLSSLSFFYIVQASQIGYITLVTACLFTFSCFYNLFFVVFSDPGYIHAKGTRKECRKFLCLNSSNMNEEEIDVDAEDYPPMADTSTLRFCGLCNVYQPLDARHCQDCGLCVVGYDHHCPWMGTCIGKFNMKAFVSFNFSWLFWLIYAVSWISFGSKLLVHS